MNGTLSWRSWGLLIAVCLIVFGVNLGGARALTNHERNVAGAAKQMVATGDWLIPRHGDRTWLEKPPLPHWVTGAFLVAFGRTTEWVARLPSVLAGIAIVVLVASLTARWLGETAGLLAGLVQATSVYMVTYARLAEADIMLAAIVVAAIVAFVHLQGIGLPAPSPRGRRLAIAFWVLLGLSNLCKGLLFGAGIVLLPVLVWLLWRREAAAWKRLWSPLGLALGAVVAAAWPVVVAVREPAALDLWFAHTFGRAAGDLGYGEPWWYYLVTPLWQLLPWTLVTIKGAVLTVKQALKDRDSAERFTWLWGLVPIAALSLSHGKHHHYLIHCLPAFTFITTVGLLQIARDVRAQPRDTVVVAWLLAVLLAPGLLVATFLIDTDPSHRVETIVIGVVAAVTALLSGIFALRARPDGLLVTCLVALLFVIVLVHVSLMPKRDGRRHDRDFLRTVHERVDPGTPIVVTGGEEVARHVFYVQAPVIGVWDPRDIADHVGDAPVVFVVGRQRHAPALRALGSVTVVARSEHTHKETSLQDRHTLFAVRRDGR